MDQYGLWYDLTAIFEILSWNVPVYPATVLLSLGIGLAVCRMVRGITFFGINTDNEKQARAAAKAGQWRWISDMHKYGSGKTRMKDAFVLALVGMQRILGDRTTDYPLVVLCVLSNSISAVLLFIVAKMYWGTEIGLLVFALFITSFWPYLTALFGGPICLAQMFVLASVYLMQIAEFGAPLSGLALYFASGLTIGLVFFSSASARKYLPLLAGAFFYSQRNAFSMVGEGVTTSMFPLDGVRLAVACSAMVILLAVGLVLLSYRQVVTAMYFERAPVWLNQVIAGRDRLSLEHYLAHAGDRIVQLLVKPSFVLVLYVGVCLVFVRSSYFYYSHFSLLLGICLVFVLFTYPNMIENVEGYFAYWNAPRLYGHFRLYVDYFKSIGRPISENMRGAGLQWVIRFFWRIAPFHSIYYVMSAGLLAYMLLLSGLDQRELWMAVGLVVLSLSPVLVGEITRGPQEGRSNYPAFLSMLLLVGYSAFKLDKSLPFQPRLVFWSVSMAGLLASTVWNLWTFLNDVWPARMAPVWLARALGALRIKEFYTYDTPYNDAFVNAMPQDVLEKCDLHFVNTLAEVREGYIVVPGTSAKAWNMEGQRCAIERGDFKNDPVLNQLIDSREITHYAVASFKTFGTSRMWNHESEVPSYRDLILGEIREYDRWRGRAWILDAGKMHTEGRYPGAGRCHAKQSIRKGSDAGYKNLRFANSEENPST